MEGATEMMDMLASFLGAFKFRRDPRGRQRAPSAEEPPLKVRVSWRGGISVDVAEQFRRKKMLRTLELLQEIPEEDAVRRPAEKRG